MFWFASTLNMVPRTGALSKAMDSFFALYVAHVTFNVLKEQIEKFLEEGIHRPCPAGWSKFTVSAKRNFFL